MEKFYNENCLSFLPKQSPNKKWDFVKILQENFLCVSKTEDYEFQERIVQLILEKCTGENPKWGREEYVIFQKEFRRITPEQLRFIKTSVVRCLEADRKEILLHLKQIATTVSFYPEVNRTYIEKEKRFAIVPKEIEMMDCFHLLNLLYSNMFQFVYNQALELMCAESDFEMLYETISEVYNRHCKEEQRPYLEAFDHTFSYVRESSLYHNLYENFREQYFPILLGRLTRIENANQYKEHASYKSAYYDHKTASLYRRDRINKLKRKSKS